MLTLLASGGIALLVVSLTDDEPTKRAAAPLKCDNLLRQSLQATPGGTASAGNANAIIDHVQSQRPEHCPPSTWNPLVNDVGRDYRGNIEISFSAAATPGRHLATDVATAHYLQPHPFESGQARSPSPSHHPSFQRRNRIPSVDSGLTYFGQMRAMVRPCRTKQDLDKLFCQGSARV